MKDSSYLKMVAEEWRLFRDGIPLGPTPTVRRLILDSWKRSRDALGARDPIAGVLPLRGEELTRKLDENRELITGAGPVMEQYRALLQSSNSVFLLASSDGIILYRHGAPGIIARMEHLDVGVVATEDREGTNGISLCIMEKRPVEVFGPEHYNAKDHNWCCVSAPLRSGNGFFVGVLTVILPLEEFHSHTTGMLVAAANNINARHQVRDLLDDQQALFELCGGGVLLLDPQGGVKSTDAQARALLGLPSPPRQAEDIRDVVRGGEPFLSLLKKRRDVLPREFTLELETGRQQCEISARVTPGGSMAVRLSPPGETRRRVAQNEERTGVRYGFEDIAGASPALRRSRELARIAAREDVNVLLLGESGTGKELFAHAIHGAGPRRRRPFIILNCGAIPRELVQSELFGYAAGAFTGAAREGRSGRFEQADGGTLFLAEIGEMPLDAQVSLLRLIQNGEVSRIGGRTSLRADVRIIAASNRDLRQAVREGSFREDLFHRLNVFPIHIPPLRERDEDIAILARHFLKARPGNRRAEKFSPSALTLLKRHCWPGNVRELENIVLRAALLASSPVIEPAVISACLEDSLPPPASCAVQSEHAAFSAITRESADAGRHHLGELLARHQGNVRAAADAIGVSRSTLYGRLARCGLNPAAFRPR